MIERHETVLGEYTDERLTAKLADPQPSVRDRARLLLQAPPEYRQGVEVHMHERCTRTRWTDSGSVCEPTGVGFDDARREALAILAGQGVQLNKGA
jgi:hypothetical protein